MKGRAGGASEEESVCMRVRVKVGATVNERETDRKTDTDRGPNAQD